MKKFIYYYKLYFHDVQVHRKEIFAINQEAANYKWSEFLKFHNAFDVTKEQEVKNEKQEVY